jgi:hypothetical protein
MRWLFAVPAAVAVAGLLAGSLSASAAVGSPAGRQQARAATAADRPVYAFNTGLALTVPAKPDRGSAVRVRPYTGRGGQRWVTGSHQSLRPSDDKRLCLNVAGDKYRSGAELQLWTCDGHASERFTASAPSADTRVFSVEPAVSTRYCLTTLTAPPYESGSRVGLERCAGLTTQTWSHANLDGVAGYLDDAVAVQALHPATAGSAITATTSRAPLLAEYWISSYTGARNDSPVQLHPVEDTALCAALSAPEGGGVTLQLAGCDGSGGQEFTGIPLLAAVGDNTWSYLMTADTLYCVQAAAGPADARPVRLGPCAGTSLDFWQTDLSLTGATSGQFQEIYAGPDSYEFSMTVTGNGSAGSGVALAFEGEAAGQVWTDLAPGQATATGNPDGSISLRPLSDENLCLTVPGNDYATGVQLTVQACDGQPDQEFARGVANGPTGLIAAGDNEYCVAAPAGITAAGAIELEPCVSQDDQTWNTVDAWYGWAGVR